MSNDNAPVGPPCGSELLAAALDRGWTRFVKAMQARARERLWANGNAAHPDGARSEQIGADRTKWNQKHDFALILRRRGEGVGGSRKVRPVSKAIVGTTADSSGVTRRWFQRVARRNDWTFFPPQRKLASCFCPILEPKAIFWLGSLSVCCGM